MPSTPTKTALRQSNSNSGQQIAYADETSTDVRKIVTKACTAGSDWPDKDELLDVLYWLKQIVSALIGVVWAIIPMYGIFALGCYVVLSTVICHVYVTSFQKVDEDALGGAWEMAKEGFGSAFATFMVVWIIGYSSLYFPS